jgi:5'-nucleotidase
MTVRVCAPQVEQSGRGRGVTLAEPLRVNAIGAKQFHHEVTPHRDATERRETA